MAKITHNITPLEKDAIVARRSNLSYGKWKEKIYADSYRRTWHRDLEGNIVSNTTGKILCYAKK